MSAPNRIPHLLLLGLLMGLAACAKQQSQLQTAWLASPYTDEELSELYHTADTVISRHDTLFIVNTRRDTVLVETGIFTYLQYGYPLATPYAPIALTRQAMGAEKAGDRAEAKRCYRAVANYFQYQWLPRKGGFENGGFSDINDALAHNVNVRLLAANAYEKLGEFPKALAVLAPYLANAEATKSKIQQRYVELCLRQYGQVATRRALDNSGRTIHHRADSTAPEQDYWCVMVFGAAVGVADFATDTLTPRVAQQLVRRQPYYKLVK